MDRIDDMQEELIDRFGKLPDAVKALIETHRLRILAKGVGIVKIDAHTEAANLQFMEKPPIDPIKITEYSIVFSAVALPLTYFPVLIVANDPNYLGEKTNSRLSNVIGIIMLIIVTLAALAAIPLMIATKAGA